MASPSRPVNITSPTFSPRELDFQSGSFASGTPLSGTPDIRALRAQYVASSTPPLGNIPPRPSSGTPGSYRDQSNLSLPAGISPSPAYGTPRFGPSVLAGISARRPSTPASVNTAGEFNSPNLDDLPDEEKARVLRRHLVSKQERQARPESSNAVSRNSSFRSGHTPQGRREDTEPFPVPYDAPGADVTWVYFCAARRRDPC